MSDEEVTSALGDPMPDTVPATDTGETPVKTDAETASAFGEEAKTDKASDAADKGASIDELWGKTEPKKPEGNKPNNPADQTGGAQNGENKPSDGNDEKPEDGKKPEEKKPGFSDEDYNKGLKADESLGKEMIFDRDLVKSVLPHVRAAGITPEQFNTLANEVAKYQMAEAKKAEAARTDNLKRMNAEVKKMFSGDDFKLINQGKKAFFKDGGHFDHLLRYSEIGSDPEVLAMLKYIGQHSKADDVAGAGASVGNGKTPSLAAIWR